MADDQRDDVETEKGDDDRIEGGDPVGEGDHTHVHGRERHRRPERDALNEGDDAGRAGTEGRR